MIRISRFLLLFCAAAALSGARAETRVHSGLVFAEANGVPLLLDLFVPSSAPGSGPAPLVLFLHGGGWSGGSREKGMPHWLLEHGFAIASADYRLVSRARFPAQLHDAQAAVRWLRAMGASYGCEASQIAVMGESAGGTLALLLATTADEPALDGRVGPHLNQSPRVACVVSYAGPADFLLRSRTQPSATEEPRGTVYGLLGGPVRERPELARLASPVSHVSPRSAPLLALHGDRDTTVLLDQSESIVAAYRAAGAHASLLVVAGAGHWGPPFHTLEVRSRVLSFLRSSLSPPHEK